MLLQKDTVSQWMFVSNQGHLTTLVHSNTITKTCPCNVQKIFGCENKNFHWKKNIFLIFAQNIDCGYMLELPRRGGSNEYPQSMFWSKNKKNRFHPAHPRGLRGYTFHGHVFLNDD